VLQKWYQQRKDSVLIVPSYDGAVINNINKSWARLMRDVRIENFRFNDCRPDFASKPVVAGVDLNTVPELLGHSDFKMTLWHAHLVLGRLGAKQNTSPSFETSSEILLGGLVHIAQ